MKNRRDFIKTSAIALAGLSLTACVQNESENEVKQNKSEGENESSLDGNTESKDL